MRVLVFGKSGQVATELAKRAPNAVYLGRDVADLADPASLGAQITAHAPQLVINAAAYTAVDKAEDEEELATRVNGHAPGAMARACAAADIPFLHISTDYVFDGTGEIPWTEDMPTDPKGAYGRSKLVGEQQVAEAGGQYAILRTAWVFSAHGNNFVKTMLRLSETRDTLNVVNDQIGGPTSAGDIAAALLTMGDAFVNGRGQNGLYHFTGEPHVSWAGFARETFAQTGKTTKVDGIPSAQYPTPAARPLNSRLDCQKIATVFGISAPNWRKSLGTVLTELGT